MFLAILLFFYRAFFKQNCSEGFAFKKIDNDFWEHEENNIPKDFSEKCSISEIEGDDITKLNKCEQTMKQWIDKIFNYSGKRFKSQIKKADTLKRDIDFDNVENIKIEINDEIIDYLELNKNSNKKYLVSTLASYLSHSEFKSYKGVADVMNMLIEWGIEIKQNNNRLTQLKNELDSTELAESKNNVKNKIHFLNNLNEVLKTRFIKWYNYAHFAFNKIVPTGSFGSEDNVLVRDPINVMKLFDDHSLLSKQIKKIEKRSSKQTTNKKRK